MALYFRENLVHECDISCFILIYLLGKKVYFKAIIDVKCRKLICRKRPAICVWLCERSLWVKMDTIKILDKNGTFQLDDAENTSGLYFPIASETGLKSDITPNLGGDAKIAQTSFLMEPVSIENLHNNRSTRNFWCMVDGQRPWSATGASAEAENDRDTENQEDSTLTAGFLWQKVERTAKNGILESKLLLSYLITQM